MQHAGVFDVEMLGVLHLLEEVIAALQFVTDEREEIGEVVGDDVFGQLSLAEIDDLAAGAGRSGVQVYGDVVPAAVFADGDPFGMEVFLPDAAGRNGAAVLVDFPCLENAFFLAGGVVPSGPLPFHGFQGNEEQAEEKPVSLAVVYPVDLPQFLGEGGPDHAFRVGDLFVRGGRAEAPDQLRPDPGINGFEFSEYFACIFHGELVLLRLVFHSWINYPSINDIVVLPTG